MVGDRCIRRHAYDRRWNQSDGVSATAGWAPIGDEQHCTQPIKIDFDCCVQTLQTGHTDIRASTSIRDARYIGLFGYMGSSGEIRGLGLEGGL